MRDGHDGGECPIQIEIPLKTDAAAGAELLRANKTLLVRRAIAPDLLRAYGDAWRRHQDEFSVAFGGAAGLAQQNRVRNDFFHRVHQLAGLEPLAFVKVLARSPTLDMIRGFFGTPVVLSTWENLVSQIIMPYAHLRTSALPFHQDGGRHSATCVRAWVLLHPETAGDDSPGVELLPTRATSTILPFETERPTNPVYRGLETAHAEVSAVAATAASWTPIVRRGDVLVFCGDCLHRTYTPPQAAARARGLRARLTRRFPRWLPQSSPLDRWAVQVTLYPGSPEFLAEATSEYCVLAPDHIIFPTSDAVERWVSDPPKESPEQKLTARPGFERIAL